MWKTIKVWYIKIVAQWYTQLYTAGCKNIALPKEISKLTLPNNNKYLTLSFDDSLILIYKLDTH